MTDLRKDFNELLKVNIKEVDNLSKEYLMLFTSYYNENRFSALTTLVTLRDETKKRLIELEECLSNKNIEILNSLKRAIDRDVQQLDTKEDSYTEIVGKVNRLLNSLLDRPNFNLYTNIYKTIELFKPNYSSLESEFPYKLMSDIDELIGHSRVLHRVRILNGTASVFIENIIDFGLPIEISSDNTHYLLDDFKVEIPVEIPDPSQKYIWYENFFQDTESKEEAFNALKNKIRNIGMKLSDYKIRTTDPVNFHRAYRKWFNGGN